MSFEDKLAISDQEATENASMLKALGLGGISKEEMKVTPSLRNLNQDPAMADALESGRLTLGDEGSGAAIEVNCWDFGGQEDCRDRTNSPGQRSAAAAAVCPLV